MRTIKLWDCLYSNIVKVMIKSTFKQLRLSRVTRLCLSPLLNTWQLWCTVLLFADWNRTKKKRFGDFPILKVFYLHQSLIQWHWWVNFAINGWTWPAELWILTSLTWIQTESASQKSWERFCGSMKCSPPVTCSQTLCPVIQQKQVFICTQTYHECCAKSLRKRMQQKKKEKTAWLIVSN